jgi:hypothetical protein
MSKKTYRTMQGKEIDFESLRARNELAIAVGNAKMNARGDKLGPGGTVEKKREEVVAEYYDTNPKAAVRKATEPTVGTTAPKSIENPASTTGNATSEVKKKV